MGPHTTIIASGASIAGAAALFGIARVAASRARVYGTLLVLGLTFGVMLAQPFKPHAVGDYSLFTRTRSLFEDRFSHIIAFQYHLAGVTIHLLDEAFGKTAQSPHEAFHTLARLASFAFVLGLVLFALQQRFSRRVVRYLAIVAAAPPTLLLFGYHEFGYLPDVLIVSAIPLALVGLEEEKDHFVVAAAVLLGVGTALHGFGLVAAVFSAARGAVLGNQAAAADGKAIRSGCRRSLIWVAVVAGDLFHLWWVHHRTRPCR
jgi:hypothetical protein